MNNLHHANAYDIITFSISRLWHVNYNNSSPAGQNGRRFADDIFDCIFVNENLCISIKIPLKCIHKGSVKNIPALVQIMA